MSGSERGSQLQTLRGIMSALPVPRLELVVEREAGVPSGRTLVLDGALFRLGSNPSNELALADPRVSRFHCRLTRGESGWALSDAGSLNGTVVNGVRVREAELPLPSCRIELGDSVVRVRELRSTSVESLPERASFGELYGESRAMRHLFAVLDKVAKSDATVLIEGESGTGKELVATELARRGERAERPFLIVDCSSISPSLIESELFGHARGAFTGAEHARVGAFEAADGGTIFLDEIGELPLSMQPKLLRALEAREIRRVGENEARRVDVRVLAATNRRLEREVNHGRFREDLYFRLGVVTVRVPPLRERREDLLLLVRVVLGSLNAEDSLHLFTPAVLADMTRHDWPGNVRELRNYVERTVVLDQAAPASTRRPSEAPPAAAASQLTPDVPFKVAKEQVVSAFERRYLEALLSAADGNISRAARLAKMDRMYLYRLLQRYELRGGSLED
ncbi:MAG: sigma 54-interacting transcriptional regulator [Sorangiineae bacterium]|nr:sigma 54-interacting transcriptional regulator [Polyangiaceae bacterium]MEB2324004.1 sigma 54-interacting transcriptional regulator [Sorangiineae bacterium]